jgi:predicted aldo/keto reductase-like oxidoreductase
VAIPKILKIFNYDKITGLDLNASWQYKNIPFGDDSSSSADFYYRYNNKSVDLKDVSGHCTSKLADACTECGQCEEQCPQGISIIREIKEAHERYI